MAKSNPLPCRICGLAPQIRISDEHGQFCLFYGVRVTQDEANDPLSPLRRRCIQDGNQFTWPVKDVSPLQLLEWRRMHSEWRLTTMSKRFGIWIGAATLVLMALSLL